MRWYSIQRLRCINALEVAAREESQFTTLPAHFIPIPIIIPLLPPWSFIRLCWAQPLPAYATTDFALLSFFFLFSPLLGSHVDRGGEEKQDFFLSLFNQRWEVGRRGWKSNERRCQGRFEVPERQLWQRGPARRVRPRGVEHGSDPAVRCCLFKAAFEYKMAEFTC